MKVRKVMISGCFTVLLLSIIGFHTTLHIRNAFADTTDSWTTRLSMPTGRFDFGLAVVNGKVYAIGGQRAWFSYPYPPNMYYNVTEAYNPQTDTWTTLASMPVKRASFGTAVANNKIYTIGGVVEGSTLRNLNYEYDPITNTWTEKTPMPTSRSLFVAATVNNKIYAIGGDAEGSVEEYDPSTDSWTRKSPIPNNAGYPIGTALNNKIYVVGGYGSLAGGGKLNQVYDPLTDTWELKAELPTARYWGGIAAAFGKIFVIGGSSGAYSQTKVNEIYDPETDSWSSGTPIPTAREAFGMVSIDKKIYAIGGYTYSDHNWVYLTKNEEYTIPGDFTPPTISILSPENRIYYEKEIPLTFAITETTSWIGYNLDEQLNVTIAGNTVLSGLSEGSHSVTVYAKDTAENTGASATIYFDVEIQPPYFQYEWLVIVSVVVIGVSGVIGFFFYRKRKTYIESRR